MFSSCGIWKYNVKQFRKILLIYKSSFLGFFWGGCFCVCVCLFRAALAAYGSSQARGWIRAIANSLCQSHSNAWSLTHWARPGIEPASSWMLVRFVSAEPQWELPQMQSLKEPICHGPIFSIVSKNLWLLTRPGTQAGFKAGVALWESDFRGLLPGVWKGSENFHRLPLRNPRC